ncbi:ankyrin repeat domain-containing protein [Streptomyces sp. NPDC048603]|uniref:ankyrin repeat domain-containing protein n=1 Tax=Streptomyces sp. NPDC048603 TaxID=3365577 RepID=UPI00372241D0
MTTNERTDWDGVTTADVYADDTVRKRGRLADAARDGRWEQVLELLAEDPERVNSTRIGGASGYSPLHQAAWHGAGPEVTGRLVDLGAWRTLPTGSGERAVDIALSRGHTDLVPLLTPVVRHPLPPAVQGGLERRLHALIAADSRGLAERHRLRMPPLGPLTELTRPRMYFPVPGMYGGFSWELDGAALVVESWSRVAGGSGRRHRVTPEATELIAEGFV